MTNGLLESRLTLILAEKNVLSCRVVLTNGQLYFYIGHLKERNKFADPDRDRDPDLREDPASFRCHCSKSPLVIKQDLISILLF